MADPLIVPTTTIAGSGSSPISNVLSPFLSPTSWDQITIAGSTWGTPLTNAYGFLDGVGSGGSVEIEGAARFWRLDQKNPSGQDGAIQTYRGKKPIVFKLIFNMWTDAQFTYWISFSSNLVAEKALDIQHPALAVLGIQSIMVKSVGAVKKVDERLMFRSVVEVHEFLPPPPVQVTTTPLGALNVPTINIIGTVNTPARLAAIQHRDAAAAAVVDWDATHP